jgi:hypothetical protein
MHLLPQRKFKITLMVFLITFSSSFDAVRLRVLTLIMKRNNIFLSNEKGYPDHNEKMLNGRERFLMEILRLLLRYSDK